MMNPSLENMFEPLRRQKFRGFFQPSRIVLAVVPMVGTTKVNLITLCFNMHVSYKPPMIGFAINDKSFSWDLFQNATECVLAVPGESLAKETLFCGLETGSKVDKVEACNFRLIESSRVSVPSIEQAIANIQVKITNKVVTGDHLTVFGEVMEYAVNTKRKELNLVSVGPQHEVFQILAQKGIHRIAVVKNSPT